MTSISTSLAATARPSPRARIDARLEAATSAGTISKTDETAISGALDDIDKALSAGSATSTTSTGGTQAKGADMKGKIDSLIDQEVKDGKLTDDQASELKDLFGSSAPAQADGSDATGATDANGKTQGTGGVHHGGHHHKKAASDASISTSTSSTSTTDSAATKLDTLISLLQKLRDSMTSTDTYGGTTASASSTGQTALLIDKSA